MPKEIPKYLVLGAWFALAYQPYTTSCSGFHHCFIRICAFTKCLQLQGNFKLIILVILMWFLQVPSTMLSSNYLRGFIQSPASLLRCSGPVDAWKVNAVSKHYNRRVYCLGATLTATNACWQSGCTKRLHDREQQEVELQDATSVSKWA